MYLVSCHSAMDEFEKVEEKIKDIKLVTPYKRPLFQARGEPFLPQRFVLLACLSRFLDRHKPQKYGFF